MPYKWKPSKAQKKAFAERMKDPVEQAEYNARKEAKAEKRRATSKFNYSSAGGWYVPTQIQYEAALRLINSGSLEQMQSCSMVVYGYECKEKVHHDNIHIVNELIRANQ